jgi:hypothetical protein
MYVPCTQSSSLYCHAYTPHGVCVLALTSTRARLRQINGGPSPPRSSQSACSTGTHALGGPHPQDSSFFIFAIYMLVVLAHILIFGSLHHLYASYIYVLCLTAPTLFLMISSLRLSLILFVCAPLCAIYLEGYKLVATSFPPPGPSVSHCPRYQLRQKLAQLIFRDQNYVSTQ